MKIKFKIIVFSMMLTTALVSCKQDTHRPISITAPKESFMVKITGTPTTLESPIISNLRKEAHKRGLRWFIICAETSDPLDNFFGYAEQNSVPENATWIEDGAEPYWHLWGSTQEDAAYRLLLAIKGPPNGHPYHKPVEQEYNHHTKVCPPMIEGN